jgi:hypothetical protein
MPVQFVCEHCDKLLKVGRKKIGCEVACPTCGKPLIVPDEEAAAMSVAMRTLGKSYRRGDPPLPEFVVYDDLDAPPASPRGGAAPAVAESPRAATAALPAAARATPPPAAAPSVRQSRVPVARSAAKRGAMLLISRNTLYLQAALFCVLGLVAFGAGYLVGIGRGPVPDPAAEAPPQVAQIVDGTLVYTSGAGMVVQDAGSVVIAIPVGKLPSPKWPAKGLGPRDPQPAEGSQLMLTIEELGARYTRTDEDGNYLLSLPAEGRYQLVFISRNARRASGVEVAPADLDLLRRYFTPATELVGRNKYGLQVVELSGGGIAHHSFDFGADGR